MAPGQTVEVKDLPQDLTDGQGFTQVGYVSPAPPPQPQPSVQPVPTGGYHTIGGGIDGAAAVTNGHVAVGPAPVEKLNWIALLETEAAQMLTAGRPEVMDALGRIFESTLIKTALKHTHGRKNDAAVRLGIGRNTITRKIQELGIDGAKED